MSLGIRGLLSKPAVRELRDALAGKELFGQLAAKLRHSKQKVAWHQAMALGPNGAPAPVVVAVDADVLMNQAAGPGQGGAAVSSLRAPTIYQPDQHNIVRADKTVNRFLRTHPLPPKTRAQKAARYLRLGLMIAAQAAISLAVLPFPYLGAAIFSSTAAIMSGGLILSFFPLLLYLALRVRAANKSEKELNKMANQPPALEALAYYLVKLHKEGYKDHVAHLISIFPEDVQINLMNIMNAIRLAEELNGQPPVGNQILRLRQALVSLQDFNRLLAVVSYLADLDAQLPIRKIAGGGEGALGGQELGCPQLAARTSANGRLANEDSLGFAVAYTDTGEVEAILMTVDDGMGGHGDGEVASNIAVETITDCFAAGVRNLPEMYDAAQAAIEARKLDTVPEPQRLDQKAGTTAMSAMVMPRANQLLMAGVGDSWLFRIRNGQLQLLSMGHGIAAQMANATQPRNFPLLTTQEVIDFFQACENVPANMRHVIERAMGWPNHAPETGNFDLQPNDVYILASDGLEYLAPDQVAQAFLANADKSPEEIIAAAEKAVHDHVIATRIPGAIKKLEGLVQRYPEIDPQLAINLRDTLAAGDLPGYARLLKENEVNISNYSASDPQGGPRIATGPDIFELLKGIGSLADNTAFVAYKHPAANAPAQPAPSAAAAAPAPAPAAAPVAVPAAGSAIPAAAPAVPAVAPRIPAVHPLHIPPPPAAAAAAAVTTFAAGNVVGISGSNYTLEEPVGKGGMGQVWRARKSNGDPVAIKTILLKPLIAKWISDGKKPDEVRNAAIDHLLRFAQEDASGRDLDHPNLCRTYGSNIAAVFPDIVDSDKFKRSFNLVAARKAPPIFLVADYIGKSYASDECGEDLRARRATGLNEGHALELFIPLLEGLSYAHARGIYHRDIKPANIMITTDLNDREILKLVDFGIAKDANRDTQLTSAGQIVGSGCYLAPYNYTRAAKADNAKYAIVDIYQMGLVMLECLTRTNPFSSMDDAAYNQFLQDPQAIDTSTIANPKLAAVIQKMLAPKLEDNYRSIDEVIADLEAAANPSGSSASVDPKGATVAAALAGAPAAPETASIPLGTGEVQVIDGATGLPDFTGDEASVRANLDGILNGPIEVSSADKFKVIAAISQAAERFPSLKEDATYAIDFINMETGVKP